MLSNTGGDFAIHDGNFLVTKQYKGTPEACCGAAMCHRAVSWLNLFGVVHGYEQSWKSEIAIGPCFEAID